MKKKIKKFFTITNDKGLHTRPAAELVKCAQVFESKIYLGYKERRVDAKSLLGILTLGAGPDTKVYIEAEGEDARIAVESIIALAKNNFRARY